MLGLPCLRRSGALGITPRLSVCVRGIASPSAATARRRFGIVRTRAASCGCPNRSVPLRTIEQRGPAGLLATGPVHYTPDLAALDLAEALEDLRANIPGSFDHFEPSGTVRA